MKTAKVAIQEKQVTNLTVLQDYLIVDKTIQGIINKANEYFSNPDRKIIDRINKLRGTNNIDNDTEKAIETHNKIKKLHKLGFTWFVADELATRFPYIAMLYSHNPYFKTNVYEKVKEKRIALLYNGFVPPSVLDKINVAEDYFCSVTIHSINPLPVERLQIIMPRVEPVAIGWLDDIEFRWFSKQRQVKKDWPKQRTVVGVILGVWGNEEREYEILIKEENNG